MLNPRLYEQLKRAFGDVQVAKEGQPFSGFVKKDAITGKHSIEWTDRGECYRVCCPFCGDRRYRLWFQHRWGTKLQGFEFKGAARCYNEECEKRPDFYPKVCDLLDGYLTAPKPLEQPTQVAVTEMAFPGTCVPLNKLPADHFICRYMSERGYDVEELSRDWDVRWRVEGSALADHYRLVLPVYSGTPSARYLAGWQVRYFDPYLHGPKPPDMYTPKYMTSPGMRKSHILYNGWRLGMYGVVVVCEGPLDVMRVGLHGVGVLGADLSLKQESLLLDNWTATGAPVLIMLDNDMDEKAEKFAVRLRARGCTALRVKAPGGKDPGDCTRETLAAEIAARLLAAQMYRAGRQVGNHD